eukprot:TRINITY_DN14716_c0_g1_i1.p1 TRINITY_DN14716_c0_g1~~TRINITY_DN14716_c0_g1_i1.p1  ORF type:complete len:786 (+),score=139.95 TRINITY_DN14716_c0_g1_i1:84-2441(+)
MTAAPSTVGFNTCTLKTKTADTNDWNVRLHRGNSCENTVATTSRRCFGFAMYGEEEEMWARDRSPASTATLVYDRQSRSALQIACDEEALDTRAEAERCDANMSSEVPLSVSFPSGGQCKPHDPPADSTKEMQSPVRCNSVAAQADLHDGQCSAPVQSRDKLSRDLSPESRRRRRERALRAASSLACDDSRWKDAASTDTLADSPRDEDAPTVLVHPRATPTLRRTTGSKNLESAVAADVDVPTLHVIQENKTGKDATLCGDIGVRHSQTSDAEEHPSKRNLVTEAAHIAAHELQTDEQRHSLVMHGEAPYMRCATSEEAATVSYSEQIATVAAVLPKEAIPQNGLIASSDVAHRQALISSALLTESETLKLGNGSAKEADLRVAQETQEDEAADTDDDDAVETCYDGEEEQLHDGNLGEQVKVTAERGSSFSHANPEEEDDVMHSADARDVFQEHRDVDRQCVSEAPRVPIPVHGESLRQNAADDAARDSIVLAAGDVQQGQEMETELRRDELKLADDAKQGLRLAVESCSGDQQQRGLQEHGRCAEDPHSDAPSPSSSSSSASRPVLQETHSSSPSSLSSSSSSSPAHEEDAPAARPAHLRKGTCEGTTQEFGSRERIMTKWSAAGDASIIVGVAAGPETEAQLKHEEPQNRVKRRRLVGKVAPQGRRCFVEGVCSQHPQDASQVPPARRANSSIIRQSIGHTLAPAEQGATVRVRGDGWGGGLGHFLATVTEADELTFTVIRRGQLAAGWEETHVLRSSCEVLPRSFTTLTLAHCGKRRRSC